MANTRPIITYNIQTEVGRIIIVKQVIKNQNIKYMKSYTIRITKTFGVFGLFSGKSTTHHYTTEVTAENIQVAQKIAEKEFEDKFGRNGK